jgi:hypothetical protein
VGIEKGQSTCGRNLWQHHGGQTERDMSGTGQIEVNPLNAGKESESCNHDLEPTGEEYLTQLDNVSRLTRFVKCKKCGVEAIDVFVYIGTFEKHPDSVKFEG